MYSASIVDVATVGCGLDSHATSAPLRYTIKPDVERLVSRSPAESASEYALSGLSVRLGSTMLYSTVLSKYNRLCRTA